MQARTFHSPGMVSRLENTFVCFSRILSSKAVWGCSVGGKKDKKERGSMLKTAVSLAQNVPGTAKPTSSRAEGRWKGGESLVRPGLVGL